MRPIPPWVWYPRTHVFLCRTEDRPRLGEVAPAVIDQAATLAPGQFLWVDRNRRPTIIETP